MQAKSWGGRHTGREAQKLLAQGAPFYVQLDGVGPATYTTVSRPSFPVVPPQRIFEPHPPIPLKDREDTTQGRQPTAAPHRAEEGEYGHPGEAEVWTL